MRSFIGLDVPEKIKTEINKNLTRFERDVGQMIPEEKWHITLAFLGEVGDIEAITPKLTQPMLQPVSLIIKLFSINYSENKKQLWAYIDKSNSLMKVREQLLQRLDKLELTYDNKHNFTPHITLASLQDKKQDIKADEPITASWQANHLTVWQSEPGLKGSKYTKLNDIKLN